MVIWISYTLCVTHLCLGGSDVNEVSDRAQATELNGIRGGGLTKKRKQKTLVQSPTKVDFKRTKRGGDTFKKRCPVGHIDFG